MTFPSLFFSQEAASGGLGPAHAGPLRPEAAGLVSSKTSPKSDEIFINLDRGACAERRVKRLKRSVWASGHLHSLPGRGRRPSVPWFVTLTYADADGWEADHVSSALERYRRWCQRSGHACQYTWVAEIQPGRARRTGKEVVHYHLMAWLPVGVRMPKWDVAVGRRRAFWSHGMTNTERAKAGIGYLMKYLSKLGEFTQFPKGLRLYGVGGLSAAARSIRTWLNLPEWAKRSYGVGDLVRKSGRLVVLATGEILNSPYVVSILSGAIVVRATHAHHTVADAMDLALLTGQRPADVLKLRRGDVRDGALWIVQNKTGARLGIEVTGELAALLERISARPEGAISPFLIKDDDGQPLSQFALRSRFDRARKAAGVSFQFRDLRAKAATDTGDLAHSQKLLAHKNRDMTEHYVRSRIGERVKPLR